MKVPRWALVALAPALIALVGVAPVASAEDTIVYTDPTAPDPMPEEPLDDPLLALATSSEGSSLDRRVGLHPAVRDRGLSPRVPDGPRPQERGLPDLRGGSGHPLQGGHLRPR